MKKKRNSCALGILVVLLLVALDQAAKYLAAAYLKDGNSITLIQGVFRLYYLENRGAAFGVMQGMKPWFVAATFLMLAGMLYIYLKSPMEKKYGWARVILMILTAGAIGNLIDRLRLDYVIDFFYFELIDFPVFNIADIYVSCGMALLIFFCFFYYKEEDLEKLIPWEKKKGRNITEKKE